MCEAPHLGPSATQGRIYKFTYPLQTCGKWPLKIIINFEKQKKKEVYLIQI